MVEIDLYLRANEAFTDRVNQVQHDQWHIATPNTGWDVYALVNHVAGENFWMPEMLAGKTIGDVGERLEGDLLHPDPYMGWEESTKLAVESVQDVDVLERTVHASFGDISGRDYIMQNFIDRLIHAWDLARAIGASEDFDAELVAACYEALKDQADAWRSAGAFGQEVAVTEDAGTFTKLLALTGRQE